MDKTLPGNLKKLMLFYLAKDREQKRPEVVAALKARYKDPKDQKIIDLVDGAIRHISDNIEILFDSLEKYAAAGEEEKGIEGVEKYLTLRDERALEYLEAFIYEELLK